MLFSSEGEKDSLINNKKKVVDIFWVCSLGFLALKQLDTKNNPLNVYLNRKYQINKVDIENSDDYSDFVISIKLLYESGLINSVQWIKFLNYMASLKSSNYNNPNYSEFFSIVNNIPMSKIMPNSFLVGDIKRFMNGSIEEDDLVAKIHTYNMNYNVSYDFFRYSTMLRSKFYGEN